MRRGSVIFKQRRKKFDNSSKGAHLKQIFLYHLGATTPPENVTAAVEAVHQLKTNAIK